MFSVKPECSSGNNSNCDLEYSIDSDVKVATPEAPLGVDVKIKSTDIVIGLVTCKTCQHGWAFTGMGENVNYVEQGYIGDDEPHSHDEGCEI